MACKKVKKVETPCFGNFSQLLGKHDAGSMLHGRYPEITSMSVLQEQARQNDRLRWTGISGEAAAFAAGSPPIVPRYSTSVAVKPAGSPVFRPESLFCSLSPGLASLLALGVRPNRPAARKMVVDANTICNEVIS